MSKEEKRQKAVAILQAKQRQIGRLPKKGDFTPYEISVIKQALGPWPRALEAAELKPVSCHYLEKEGKKAAKLNKK